MTNLFASLLSRKPMIEEAESISQRLERRISELSRRRILLVDDDLSLQELMKQVGIGRPVEIISAATAGHAKALIKGGVFDLAILDVGILNGDGIALYRWIMEHYPETSVIFLTGGSIDEIYPKVQAIGSAPVYYKPTDNALVFLTDLLRFVGIRPAT